MLLTQFPANSEIIRHLADSLETLASGSNDPELRAVADDVLKGRRDIRDRLSSRAFTDKATASLAAYKKRLDALSPEERDTLNKQAAQSAQRLIQDPALRAIELGQVPAEPTGGSR